MTPLQQLDEGLDRLSGITRMVMTSRDGRVIRHKGEKTDQLANYVAYASVTSEQLKPYTGFHGPQHLLMEQESGDRILILPGEQIIVGLGLDMLTFPATVIDQLNPLVAQTGL